MGSDARVAAARRKLAGQADAFVAAHPANVAYLSAFRGVFDDESGSLAVLTADRCWIVTDSRYAEAARAASEGTSWQVVIAEASLAAALGDLVREAGWSSVAVETTLEYRQWRHLADTLAAQVIEADNWVEAVRAVKEPAEVQDISAAQELTDRAFEHVLAAVRPGVTEKDLALEIEFFMRRNGSDGVAFPPIVASGPNSALPHALPSDRALQASDLVVLDFGARVGGYCADMTRTVAVGHVDERGREIYDTVRAANVGATRALRAGRLGREVDAAARAVIAEAGFGQYFGHGVGHGVGLEIHELPRVGPASDMPLAAGSVVTIEPGIYIPGFGGVRIENLAVVEDAGARVLTRSTMDLLEL
jgi:Xaa-Pro aminopeptidase